MKKRFAKLVSSALAVLLFLFAVPLLTVTDASATPAVTLWPDYAAESFAGGTGTADDPYQIATGAQLARITKLCDENPASTAYRGACYVLTSDIDLSGHDWVGFGTYAGGADYRFTGVLDGNGKTINGFTVTDPGQIQSSRGIGLVGCTGGKATVKNFTLNGSIDLTGVTVGGNNAAIGVLNCWASGSSVFSDITVNATVSVKNCTATVYVGGLCGDVHNGSFVNCTMNGSVTSDQSASGSSTSAGGISGYLTGFGKIENCVNRASVTVTAKAGKSAYVGGICGCVKMSDTSQTSAFIGNRNEGAISYTGSAAAMVGGIYGTGTGPQIIRNNVNAGTVTGFMNSDGGAMCTGGIVGQMSPWTEGSGAEFSGNINHGAVTGTDQSTNHRGTAGVIGRIGKLGKAGGFAVIDSCANTAPVTATVRANLFAAGIMGYSQADDSTPYTVTFRNCVDTGSVTLNGGAWQYGICGQTRVDTTIEGCVTASSRVTAGYESTAGTIRINGKKLAYLTDADLAAGCANVDLETLGKARVRMAVYAQEDDSGIRFDSRIGKEFYAFLKEHFENVALGTLIAPTDNLVSACGKGDWFEALSDIGERSYLTVAYEQDFYAEDDDGTHGYFSGAIRNIKDTHYDLQFGAVAYVTFSLGGQDFTVYADYDPTDLSRSRSVSQIAYAAFEDRADTADPVYRFEAGESNACVFGKYSPYSDLQLSLLKKYSSYEDVGELPTVTITPAALGDSVSFHTELMSKFLADSYQNVLKYAVGTAENSIPLPVTLSWGFASNERVPLNGFTVRIGEKSDLSDARTVSTQKTTADVYNLKIGTTYYWAVTAEYGNRAYTSETATFTTAANGPRNLYIDGVTNARDLGGWATGSGGKVKQGMIYRTGKADGITEAGRKTMLDLLGIKTEFDLRADASPRSYVDSSVHCVVVPFVISGKTSGKYISTQMEMVFLLNNNDCYKQMFALLADESNYPIFFHCAIGTDRTGVTAFLINALLGVSKEDLVRDYVLSNFGNISGSRNYDRVTETYIMVIDDMEGDTFAQKTYNFLVSIGVPSADLDATIRILSEPAPQN